MESFKVVRWSSGLVGGRDPFQGVLARWPGMMPELSEKLKKNGVTPKKLLPEYNIQVCSVVRRH